jgi:hypothetical protein
MFTGKFKVGLFDTDAAIQPWFELLNRQFTLKIDANDLLAYVER